MKKLIASKSGMASMYALILCSLMLLVTTLCVQLTKTYVATRGIKKSIDLDVLIFKECRAVEVEKKANEEDEDDTDEMDFVEEVDEKQIVDEEIVLESNNSTIIINRIDKGYSALIRGEYNYQMSILFDDSTHQIIDVSYN